jgi:hypothetical protein
MKIYTNHRLKRGRLLDANHLWLIIFERDRSLCHTELRQTWRHACACVLRIYFITPEPLPGFST